MTTPVRALLEALHSWPRTEEWDFALLPIPRTEALLAGLSDGERMVVDRFRHPGRRRACLAGRLAAHRALARLARRRREQPRPWEVLSDASGAPTTSHAPRRYVSITHCDNLALAVAATEPIGVDLEALAPRPEALLLHFFSEAERDWVRAVPADEERRTNELWTRKEALAKLLQRGGDLAFALLEVVRQPAGIELRSHTTHTHAVSIARKARRHG